MTNLKRLWRRPSGRRIDTSRALSRGRFQHIDAMRAFAVLLVVTAHTNVGGIPGGSGVTIFFTISGFIITHLLLKERSRTGTFNVRSFYYRRMLKLAPPFIVLIAVPTIIYSLWNPITWSAFAAQAFFVFNWYSYLDVGPISILPGSSVVWSLSIEEQFYIFFAMLWLFVVRSKSYLKLLIVAALFCAFTSLGLRVIYAFTGAGSDRIYGGTDTRMDAIAIGILAAVAFSEIANSKLAWLRHFFRRDLVMVLAISSYVASLLIRDPIFRDTFRYTVQAVATAAIILYGLLPSTTTFRCLFDRIVGLRLIQIIGISSYSMYLMHAPLMHLLEVHLDLPHPVFRFLLLTSLGVGSGILAWRAIEVPCERLKNRHNPPRQTNGRPIAEGTSKVPS